MYSYLGLGVAAECGLGIFYYQSTPLQKQIVMNDDSTHKVGLILVKTVVSLVPEGSVDGRMVFRVRPPSRVHFP